MKKIIHLSNEGYYNEIKALEVGTWDIIAKHKTFCWLSLDENFILTKNPLQVTCKRCIKILKKRGIQC